MTDIDKKTGVDGGYRDAQDVFRNEAEAAAEITALVEKIKLCIAYADDRIVFVGFIGAQVANPSDDTRGPTLFTRTMLATKVLNAEHVAAAARNAIDGTLTKVIKLQAEAARAKATGSIQ